MLSPNVTDQDVSGTMAQPFITADHDRALPKFARLATGFIRGYVRGTATGMGRPLRVTHEVTHRCNLRCSFCALPLRAAGNEMSVSETRGVMDAFASIGTVSWGFTGGEPLIKEGIDELVVYASRTKGFLSNMVTNGTLIPDHLPALKQLAFLIVSVDGSEPVHDTLRGKGTFRKAVAGIESARRKGIPVTIQTMLSFSLLQDTSNTNVDAMLQLAKELGCRIMFQRVYEEKDSTADAVQDLLHSKGDHTQLMAFLAARKKKDPKLFYQSLPEIEYMWEHQHHELRCYAGKFYCTLDPEGAVFPCIYKRAERVPVVGKNAAALLDAFATLPKRHTCRCFNSCYNRFNHLLGVNMKTAWRFACDMFRN